MRHILFAITMLMLCLSVNGQELKVTGSRKAVRTSGDVLVFITPVASLATVLATQDWQGLKQGVFTGVTTLGVTYALKYLVKKERPDFSDNHSFPSMHTSVSFAGAAFIQRRYGWKWGIPAYAVSTYVGWSRVYGKKHDWWDVAAGAVIGAGSAYIFTRPFAKKHNLSISVAGDGHYGVYASMTFNSQILPSTKTARPCITTRPGFQLCVSVYVKQKSHSYRKASAGSNRTIW